MIRSASAQVDPTSDWLNEINRYRAAAGVSLVAEQPAWEAGLQNHLAYLANTPAQYFTGAYLSRHTENPQSPYYTPSGALEANSSDLGGGTTPVDAVDNWLTAPFHAIGILRARLSQVELGYDPASRSAGLDIIQGIDNSLPAATAPILFPGPGITTDLLAFGGESPTPLETCGWQNLSAVGLPLIAMLPQAPDPGLAATVSAPGGRTESTGGGDLCVVDEHTFTSSDPTYGSTGKAILQGDHAVLLIPRYPLTNGVVSATLQQPGQADVSWSFTVYRPPPVNSSPPSISGGSTQGQTIQYSGGSWTNGPLTAVVDQWLRCDASGSSNCQAIAGATSRSYSLTSADVGSTLRVQEIAANQGGTGAPAISAATATIQAAPPPSTTTTTTTTTTSTPATASDTPGPPLRLGLRLARGRATLRTPIWTVGLPISVDVAAQRRACRRGGHGCSWHTYSVTSRRLRITGVNTSFGIRRPSRGVRVRVAVTILAFTRQGWAYAAARIAGIEP
ncbi:MAG: CAP domain-containing protein [Solirubrobacteraceae bacterium]